MESDGLLSGDIRTSVQLQPRNQNDSVVQGSSQGLYPSTRLNGDPPANPSEPKVSFSLNERKSSVTLHYLPSGRQIKAQPSCRSSLYFHDGVRTVDFVLVWDDLSKQAITVAAEEKRRVFEKNLEREGLDLEYEKREPNGLNFIKIHAPLEVLRRYSEILKMRMPMRAGAREKDNCKRVYNNENKMKANRYAKGDNLTKFETVSDIFPKYVYGLRLHVVQELCQVQKDSKMNPLLHATQYLSQKIPALQEVHEKTNSLVDNVNSLVNRVLGKFYVDTEVFPQKSQRFTAVYSRDKEYLFDIESNDFFTPAIHSRIVQFILDRQRFSEDQNDDFAFGIERLINEWVYTAAYPLHDGDLRMPGSMRHKLYTEWASVRKSFLYQPLDYVKEYFGVKIGLYFAWLGFYTSMLIPTSIIGLICFIYSCSTLYQNQPSEDICNKKLNITMCPTCDYWCDYWNLEETCLHARVTYLFDNPSTVFFAIVMSFWAAIFLEFWKRYSGEITHRWDLTGFDIQEEHPRPQYLARLKNVKKKEVNIVTNMMEPHVPFWRMKLPATVLSFSIVLLLIALAVAAVIGVVLYRMSVLAVLAVQREPYINSYALLFTTSTAASINLCCIMVFNWIYSWVAEYLTEIELLRTQTEFDDSLTLKIYLLQFVNYYASIFYIAFFKGKFVGYPAKYNRFFSYRQEECGPGGCLMELCIQLAIIMVGKQIMNTMLEMLYPLFFKWLNTLKVKTGLAPEEKSSRSYYQWVKDFKLVEWGHQALFGEYLEMVLQYGFVTIFVAAFPLAPFFALLNNILEMRLDAKKLLTYYRRPVTQRVRDIGVWYRILDSIGKLSVISNGFIIAFTSDFIPHLVYAMTVSKNGTLDGYLEYSLSTFNTSDLDKDSRPYNSSYNVSICRYPDFREPPDSPNKYAKTSMYWHILAARLAFVVVFENIVAVVMILVRWCIPDMPTELRDQIRREAYITNEIIIQQETLRARASLFGEHINPSCPILGWGHLSGSELDLAMMEKYEQETDNAVRRRQAGEALSSDRPVMV